MSVEFSNAYQEILLDNLVSIIKQNFIFQTQLKLAGEQGKENASLQAKLNEVTSQYNFLKKDAEVIEQLKARADLNSSIAQEKERIQGALNDYMQKNSLLQSKLEQKDLEIKNLEEQISKMKTILPQSKLKKLGMENEPETIVQPVEETKVDDGSSF